MRFVAAGLLFPLSFIGLVLVASLDPANFSVFELWAWGALAALVAVFLANRTARTPGVANYSSRDERLMAAWSALLATFIRAVIVALELSVCLAVVWYASFAPFVVKWDPIGEGHDDGSPPCTIKEQVVPGRLESATIRSEVCLGAWDRSDSLFVFISKPRTRLTSKDLSFRYSADLDWIGVLPHVSWLSKTRLAIYVPDGAIQQITMKRSYIRDISIVYRIPRGEVPDALNVWERLRGIWYNSI